MNTMSIKNGRILIIDDNEDLLFAAKLFLKQHFAVVQTESSPEKIPSIMAAGKFDVILLDMNFTEDVTSGHEGFFWLGRILDIDPSAVVILITAFADFDMAVRAIKEGAADFIVKPWQNEKLLATVSAAMALSRTQNEVSDLRETQKRLIDDLDQPFHDFIGKSEALRHVFALIDKVAATDANILITGANGTGKELVARAIHRKSDRSAKPFVRVDMGALTGTLFESELFGHVKGAFTDAREDRPGRFEIASGGTLFLDEIGNLPLDLQAKILTALQNRQVIRVGSNKIREIDIRLICATNISLPDMVRGGTFRQDLLYRINTVEINIPPLRNRIDDIEPLAAHFLGIYGRKYRKEIARISGAGLEKAQEVRLARQRARASALRREGSDHGRREDPSARGFPSPPAGGERKRVHDGQPQPRRDGEGRHSQGAREVRREHQPRREAARPEPRRPISPAGEIWPLGGSEVFAC